MSAKLAARHLVLLLALAPAAFAAAPTPACRTQVIEGEVNAGQAFAQPIGERLKLLLQPIHSGWIVRIVPESADLTQIWRPDFRDYALLATPPYQSVTPLSLSTDFGFRAQDAAGWNPRRFRFATTPASYARLDAGYSALLREGPNASPATQAALAAEVAATSPALLKVLDVRLTPGTADQGRLASAVSFSFPETAHTLVPAAPGVDPALGRLVWVRFRFELEMPPGFHPAPAAKIVAHVCGSR